ncbi:MAG: hypothetical protein V1847_05115 [Candidatus Diapherotrites archaeon]
MNIVEMTCAKIVNEKKLPWFSVRHAKTFATMCKYCNVRLSDLALLTQISPLELKRVLNELERNKLVRYCGEIYRLEDREEALQHLVWLAQSGEKAVLVSKNA